MTSSEQATLRFGDFELQVRAARLLRDGRSIPLEPRAFDLLLLLAKSGGRLVEKEEILEAVWKGALVTDNALTRSVARLRKALGDSAKEPRFIETVHSRGYRFLAGVERVEQVDEGLPAESASARNLRSSHLLPWLAAAFAVGLVGLVSVSRWNRSDRGISRPTEVAPPALDPRRVAVLPLENLSGTKEDDYFVNGLTEQIISNLAQISGLRVLARTTTGTFKDDTGRIAEIAAELEAGTVLEGSARRLHDKLRIHVQLIDGESEEHLWSGEFDRTVADLFAIQSEIAMRVAEELELSVSTDRLARIRRGPTRNLSAYDLYLRGRQAYRRQTQRGNEEAIEFYKRAQGLDPDFALAEAGLANAYAQRAIKFGWDSANVELAVRSAERALELNPELPEAYKALGIVAYKQDRFLTAVELNQKALALNPSYDEAIYNLSSVLHASGRWDEALLIQLKDTGTRDSLPALAVQVLQLGFSVEGMALAEKALSTEPLAWYLTGCLALRSAEQGDLVAARKRASELRRAHSDRPGSWETSGEVELIAGDHAAAARYFKQAHQVWGGRHPESLINLARVQWIAGDHATAETLLAEVEDLVHPLIEEGSEYFFHYWAMAAIESMRGNAESAVDWYERAVDMGHRRGWPDEVDATFSSVRNDPRFQAQLLRIRSLVEEMRAAIAPQVSQAVDKLLAG